MTRKEKIATREYAFTAVFEPAGEGGFIVSFPALRGCLTQGDTLEEARTMAAKALRGYIEVLVKHGRPVPAEGRNRQPYREQIRVAVRAV